MDGLFINGTRRPKSKKEVKEAVAKGDVYILVESTSMFGGYTGPLSAEGDREVSFVGPDPYTDRRFYGTITKRGDKITVK